jgi:hypothetical protein
MTPILNIKKHINLGCAEPPVHEQHLKLMRGIAPLEDWELADLYVKHPEVTNIDARTLDGIPDGFLYTIYASHLLEHISHRDVLEVLSLWYRKLAPNGRCIVNVPDLIWACRQAIRWENGQTLEGVYDQFEGNHGLQSVFYGTHAHGGEFHQAGFTKRSIGHLFLNAGFASVVVEQMYDAHDMGVLIVEGEKIA